MSHGSSPRVDNVGHLTLYVGPMFAGKSSRLLHDLTMYADIGYSVLYINHSDDTRGDVFSSHSSSTRQLSSKITWKKVSSLGSVDISKYDVIGVDESQFFDDLYSCVSWWVHEQNMIVICAGLDSDAFLRPFGHILELVPLCDRIIKLTAKCYQCLKESPRNLVDAPFTMRLDSSKEQKVIGGADLYIPVCRHHYRMAFSTI